MRDPLRPPRGASNLGEAALARSPNQRWEQGTIVTYNSATHTSSIRTNSGRPLQDVPQMKPSNGAYEHLAVGTTVVVSWDLGWPVIVGCLEDVGRAQAAIPAMPLTGVVGVGSADPTQATHGTNNYAPPSAPTDMGPGDWARVGTMGNHVAVLEGGMTLMGSPSAQIRSSGTAGVIQTIARQLHQVTDFGELRVENDGGRTSLVLRAGSTPATQTGADEQHWTIRLDLGASGDLFDFTITEPEGRALFRMHVAPDGHLEIYGDGGVDISSGRGQGQGAVRGDHAGARTTAVGGDDVHTVDGASHTTVLQGQVTTVNGDVLRTTGGAVTEFVTDDLVTTVGATETRMVAGARVSVLGDVDTTTAKGAWSVRTTKDASITAEGDATYTAKGRARFDGRKIVLGKDGRHPLPKFDVFLRDFGSFLGTLQTAISNALPANPFAVPAYTAKLALYAAKVNAGSAYKSTKVSND